MVTVVSDVFAECSGASKTHTGIEENVQVQQRRISGDAPRVITGSRRNRAAVCEPFNQIL